MRFSKTLVAVGLVIGALTARSSAQPAGSGRFVAGEILVKFRPGANANAKAEAHKAAGATSLVEIARTGVQRVRVPAGAEAAVIARYQRNPNVLYAERNSIRSIPMPTAHTGGPQVVPGDYYFDEQWGLDNTGQAFHCIPWVGGELCFFSGTADADIDAPEAWAILEGSSSVTVAVIDSGVDYTHPDLAANYAGGYDFVFSDSDPMDDHGHGTHVAGTIAAALNNAHRRSGGSRRRRWRGAQRAHPGLQSVPLGRHVRRFRDSAGHRPSHHRRRQCHQHEPGRSGVLAVAGRGRAGRLERRPGHRRRSRQRRHD